MGLLCYKCGVLGHRVIECTSQQPLEIWEQTQLRRVLRQALGYPQSNQVFVQPTRQYQYPQPAPQPQSQPSYQQPSGFGSNQQHPYNPTHPTAPISQSRPNPFAVASPNQGIPTLTLDEIQKMDHVQGHSVELIMGLAADTTKRRKMKKLKEIDSFLGEGKRALEDPEPAQLDGYHQYRKIPKYERPVADAPTLSPPPIPLPPSIPTVEDEVPDEENLREAAHFIRQSESMPQPSTPTAPFETPSVAVVPPVIPSTTAPAVPQYRSIYTQPSVPPAAPARAMRVPHSSRLKDPTPPQPAAIPHSQPTAAAIPDIQELRAVKKRVSKELKQIVGRLGLEPINYKDITQGFKITISLMDLLQISPDYAKNLRKLSTRANEKKKRRQVPAAFVTAHAVESTLPAAGVIYPKLVTPRSEDRAFRLPVMSLVTIKGSLVQVDLKDVTCAADQGSDINIVTRSLAESLKLDIFLVSEAKPLHMGTADGKASRLEHFTIIKVGVLGIWREVWAFIRPSGSSDRHLLLGTPWLHDVRAVIDVRGSNICIGDFALGEKHTRIEGPKFQLLQTHKLMLVPTDARYKKLVEEANKHTPVHEDHLLDANHVYESASTLGDSDNDDYSDAIPDSDLKVEIDSASTTDSEYDSDSTESVSQVLSNTHLDAEMPFSGN
jgi:hypothetical protein